MSDIILARAELAALLTPIAPVRTGRAALETTSADLPVIVLWSTDDRPTEQTNASIAEHTRALSLEYKSAATDAYDDDLDTVLHNIRSAVRNGVGTPALAHATGFAETSARFFAPSDGSSIAVLQITFDITYLERL